MLQTRGFTGRQAGEGQPRTFRLEAMRHLHQGVPWKRVLQDEPRNGQAALVPDLDFNYGRLADFQHRLGRNAGWPRDGRSKPG